MKKICIVSLFLSVAAHGQPAVPLTLETCYELAEQNYPLIKQRDLIAKTKEYSVSNAAKGYLPQLTVSGQATYQSDVVQFPISVPGIALPVLSKDQYRIGGELNQVIYDAGTIHYNKEAQRISADIQEQGLEVNLYSVRDRVSQLYFGILLLEAQVKQQQLRKDDLQNGLAKTEALYNNGTAFKSNVDELKAELLNADQGITQMLSDEKAYRVMLGVMIHEDIDEHTLLEEPHELPVLTQDINRPELKLYDYQEKNIDLQKQQLKTGYLPKINLFAQGYYGRPTYNIVDNKFGLFGLAGISLKWPLFNLYTNKNSKTIFDLSRQNTEVQKETFLFNTQLAISQESEAVIKYRTLVKQDEEIIPLRASVKNAANAQLENGVLTSHDYIIKVNDENEARLNMILHKIQLLQSQYGIKNTSGN